MNKIASILLSAAFCCSLSALNLAKVSVPVVDQSQSSLDNGLKQAIQQEAMRLTGYNSSLDSGALQQLVAKPQQFLQSYGYAPNTTPLAVKPWLLQASYDQNGLSQWLQSQQVPVWGNRPEMLIWLGVAHNNQIAWQTPGSGDAVATDFTQEAKQIGLPLSWPVLDLEDHLALPKLASWTMPDAFNKANTRYQMRVVLAGVINPPAANQDGWSATWQLWLDDQSLATWQTQAATQHILLSQSLISAAQSLAAKLTGSSAASQNFELYVAGIDSLDQYAKLMQQLKALTPVQQVNLEDLNANGVQIGLTALATQAQLQQLLNTVASLSPMQNPPAACSDSSATTPTLCYQFSQ